LKALPLLVLVAWVARVAVHAADIEGQVSVRTARTNANAVVYIDKIPGKRFSPPAEPVKLDQFNLTFVPHVLPVLVGTTVAFPNSDEIRHNVFSPGPLSRFDLGTYPRKQVRYQVFDKPGTVTLLCNVHVEMSAFVVVTETPYFAVTDNEGRYTIKDVPPGKYLLKVWHEKAKPSNMEVVVDEAPLVKLPVIEVKK
jgi:plastocyanin